MDFPIFHLDWLGNRMLIAVIAVVHVLVNHALAVGFIPFITFIEYLGFRRRQADPEAARAWDDLARRMMAVCFVLTTTVGALTGVGIWLSTALVNPDAIGSLIRVFFGAWFTEWIVFVLEVVFVILYYYSWHRSNDSDAAKRRHIHFGAALSAFSWLTMAIIVAILGFMMDPGAWPVARTFLSGFANPIYVPQLYFRTALAMMMGGAVGLLLAALLTGRDSPIRRPAVRYAALWLLVWTPLTAVGAFVYRAVIPGEMMRNMPTAVSTLVFSQWYDSLVAIIAGSLVAAAAVALWGFALPRWLPRAAAVVPILCLAFFVGSFERVREFIRKPYVIKDYMYANGLRVAEYPLYQRDGVLPHAAFAAPGADRLAAGRDVFLVACSRCHTITGINSVTANFRRLAPPGQTMGAADMRDYILRMHKAWYFMPPFPGNAVELGALVDYIRTVDQRPAAPPGAQDAGVFINPDRRLPVPAPAAPRKGV